MFAALAASGLSSNRSLAQTQQSADSRRIVLLLADAPGDPFVARIKAEISSLGLDVLVRPPKGAIEASARAAHAVAAVRMLPSRNGIEVWMADATSGRSLLRQTIVDEDPGGPNQNVVALQTAELLRTSLFPRQTSEPPKPDVPASEAPVVHEPPAAPLTPRSSSESALSGSLGVLYGAGGATPSFQAGLSYRHLWNRVFGVAISASAPIVRGTMTGTEGSADVGAIIAGAGPVARFSSEQGRLALTLGLGGAFVAVLSKGHPTPEVGPQLISNSSTAYTGLGYASVAFDWRLSSWFGLGVSGLAGATTSRVHVRFAGNDAGTWGIPVLAAALFGEVAWR
jgi:hypothetical protein